VVKSAKSCAIREREIAHSFSAALLVQHANQLFERRPFDLEQPLAGRLDQLVDGPEVDRGDRAGQGRQPSAEKIVGDVGLRQKFLS